MSGGEQAAAPVRYSIAPMLSVRNGARAVEFYGRSATRLRTTEATMIEQHFLDDVLLATAQAEGPGRQSDCASRRRATVRGSGSRSQRHRRTHEARVRKHAIT